MTTFERPAPDLSKIVEAWQTWRAGGEALPGRSMADLKIGGADRLLETLAADTEAVAIAFTAWTSWEKGKLSPEDALEALSVGGFDDVVEALATD